MNRNESYVKRWEISNEKKLKWKEKFAKSNIDNDFEYEKVNDMIMLNARFQKITRLNASLNYKNLSLFKIIKIYHINNAYKLNLLATMKSIFSIFHSWLLHLENEISLENQHQIDLELIIIDNEFVYEIEEIIDSRINNKRNDLVIDRKKCLQYRIRWANYVNVNTIFVWQIFIDVENVLVVVANFHHKYFDKSKSHDTFVRSKNWTFFEKNQ